MKIDRDPQRIPIILERLGELWKLCPNLRLGQIIDNLSTSILVSRSEDLFYTEDEVILEYINKESMKVKDEMV